MLKVISTKAFEEKHTNKTNIQTGKPTLPTNYLDPSLVSNKKQEKEKGSLANIGIHIFYQKI